MMTIFRCLLATVTLTSHTSWINSSYGWHTFCVFWINIFTSQDIPFLSVYAHSGLRMDRKAIRCDDFSMYNKSIFFLFHLSVLREVFSFLLSLAFWSLILFSVFFHSFFVLWWNGKFLGNDSRCRYIFFISSEAFTMMFSFESLIFSIKKAVLGWHIRFYLMLGSAASIQGKRIITE